MGRPSPSASRTCSSRAATPPTSTSARPSPRPVPRPGVRLHARESALRQVVEDRPRRSSTASKKYITDPRFSVDAPGAKCEKPPLIPRVSDGQLLFLVNMLSKMKRDSGQPHRHRPQRLGALHRRRRPGESNIRRWILENDWLEAIIGLPLDMFYNTGIATYIWVLSNRKPPARQGKVQLIDATQYFGKLRKNLGTKNCELTPEHIHAITSSSSTSRRRRQQALRQRRLRLLEDHRGAPAAPHDPCDARAAGSVRGVRRRSAPHRACHASARSDGRRAAARLERGRRRNWKRGQARSSSR